MGIDLVPLNEDDENEVDAQAKTDDVDADAKAKADADAKAKADADAKAKADADAKAKADADERVNAIISFVDAHGIVLSDIENMRTELLNEVGRKAKLLGSTRKFDKASFAELREADADYSAMAKNRGITHHDKNLSNDSGSEDDSISAIELANRMVG